MGFLGFVSAREMETRDKKISKMQENCVLQKGNVCRRVYLPRFCALYSCAAERRIRKKIFFISLTAILELLVISYR